MPLNTDYITVGRPEITAKPLDLIQTGSPAGIDAAGNLAAARVQSGVDTYFDTANKVQGLRSNTQKMKLQDNMMAALGPNATTTDAELVAQYEKTLGAQVPKNPDGTINLNQVRTELANHVKQLDAQRMSRFSDSTRVADRLVELGGTLFDSNGKATSDAERNAELSRLTAAALAAKAPALKAPTADQSRLEILAQQMGDGNKLIEEHFQKFKDEGVGSATLGWVGEKLPGPFAGAGQSPDYRGNEAGEGLFLSGVGYSRSGANVTPAETARFRKSFLPAFQDDAATLATKTALRQRAVLMLQKVASGELVVGDDKIGDLVLGKDDTIAAGAPPPAVQNPPSPEAQAAMKKLNASTGKKITLVTKGTDWVLTVAQEPPVVFPSKEAMEKYVIDAAAATATNSPAVGTIPIVAPPVMSPPSTSTVPVIPAWRGGP